MPTPSPPSDRALERRIDELAESFRSLERRLATVEEEVGLASPADAPVAPRPALPADVTPVAAPDPSPEKAPARKRKAHKPDGPRWTEELPAVSGRTFLVLAGAFLLRAVTDAGPLPTVVGAAIGLAYGSIWWIAADRAAATDRRLGATFHGLAATAISFPLLWETTTTLAAFPAGVTAVLIALVTAVGSGVAWRRSMRWIGWMTILAALPTAYGLGLATRRVVPFAWTLLFVFLVATWLTRATGWKGLRWPAALFADLAVLQLVLVATRAEGPPASYEPFSFPAAVATALVLLGLTLATTSVPVLRLARRVDTFDMVQALLVLVVGFGGAVRIAATLEAPVWPLGLGALLLAAGSYGVAFFHIHRHLGRGRSLLYYSSLGLFFTMSAAALLTTGLPLTIAWTLLAVILVTLGGRHDHLTLRSHSAIALVGAALQSGLIAKGFAAFALAPGSGWERWTVGTVLPAAAGVASYLIVWSTRSLRTRPRPPLGRLPSFVLAVIGVVGLAWALVSIGVLVTGITDPSALATMRTAVLAVAAIGVGLLGRRYRLVLGWLVYPLLAVGGLKILLQDLPAGRPTTLFLAFAIYGGALILAPRILRRPRSPDDEPALDTHEPADAAPTDAGSQD